MSIGMKRHEVAEHVVVGDLTVHVDGREAADPDVDGDDRARTHVASVTDRHVGSDRGRGMDHGRPGQPEWHEPARHSELGARQAHAEHEAGVRALRVLADRFERARQVTESRRHAPWRAAVVEEYELALPTLRPALLAERPRDFLRVPGGA